MVVFLRGFDEGDPNGECEECRAWRYVCGAAATARRGVTRRVGCVEDEREDRRSVDGRVSRDAIMFFVFGSWIGTRAVLVGIFRGSREGGNGTVYEREMGGPC